MSVLLDTAYLYALFDPKDRWHDQAMALQGRIQAGPRPHTHALVVAETIALAASRLGGAPARRLYDALHDSLTVHHPVKEDLDEAMELVLQFDGGLSLADAYSIVLVGREGLQAVVSFDADFDGKGLERLH